MKVWVLLGYVAAIGLVNYHGVKGNKFLSGEHNAFIFLAACKT